MPEQGQDAGSSGPVRYLALGDSYTIGTGASGPEAAFPSRLRPRLEEYAGRAVEVVNPAVNGYTTADVVRDELPLLDRVRPDLVSVLVGANDVARGWSLDDYQRGVRTIYAAVARAVARPSAVLAVSIPDWSVTPAARGFGRPDELRTRIETCNAIAQVEARTHGFLWADVSEVSRALGRDGLSEDGLHPDDRQYEAWAEAIWSAVGPRWASGLDAGADLGPARGRAVAFGEQGRKLSYGGYLRLPELLALQTPRTAQHDELLFIVVHQAYELWFRLVLHELEGARAAMQAGDVYTAQRYLRRVVAVERLLVEQVDVLDTMAPQDFLVFRSELAPASGFQSVQFREIEFVSGLRDPAYLERIEGTDEEQERLRRRLREPTLWDAFVELLGSRGSPKLADLFWDRARYGDLFEVSERLLEHDQAFGLWRARHIQMVERQIGSKTGTGGSAGAEYLRKTLPKRFFPDLWQVRAELELPDRG
jgi:tryptophan 2,3-dioxygenase